MGCVAGSTSTEAEGCGVAVGEAGGMPPCMHPARTKATRDTAGNQRIAAKTQAPMLKLSGRDGEVATHAVR